MKPPTPLTDKFLSDLKEKMKYHKIKKIKLASDIGVSKQTANRWFHNLRAPTGEFVLKIQDWMKKNSLFFL